jgi:hypothetical protein
VACARAMRAVMILWTAANGSMKAVWCVAHGVVACAPPTRRAAPRPSTMARATAPSSCIALRRHCRARWSFSRWSFFSNTVHSGLLQHLKNIALPVGSAAAADLDRRSDIRSDEPIEAPGHGQVRAVSARSYLFIDLPLLKMRRRQYPMQYPRTPPNHTRHARAHNPRVR